MFANPHQIEQHKQESGPHATNAKTSPFPSPPGYAISKRIWFCTVSNLVARLFFWYVKRFLFDGKPNHADPPVNLDRGHGWQKLFVIAWPGLKLPILSSALRSTLGWRSTSATLVAGGALHLACSLEDHTKASLTTGDAKFPLEKN